MTRVNLVQPQDLADQHAFAEWRELKMVPVKVRAMLKKTDQLHRVKLTALSVKNYTMGEGHVKFFYDKLMYLKWRYDVLDKELRARGFKIEVHDSESIFFKDIDPLLSITHWFPEKKDIEVNIQRLELRLRERPNWYRFHGKIRPPEFFLERFHNQLLVDVLKQPV